jgi:hypothetical protein
MVFRSDTGKGNLGPRGCVTMVYHCTLLACSKESLYLCIKVMDVKCMEFFDGN